MNLMLKVRIIVCCLAVFIAAGSLSHAAPDKKEILAAMEKATSFMMNTVAYNDGFVWKYSNDLSQRWGEIPARKTQIWIQGATNDVGEMFLDAFQTTGDARYLEYARRIADTIVLGQYPSGGWHYFIDFDMPGIQRWYDTVASKYWGWEEYYHYYGNCTFDDGSTSGSIRLLMHIYAVTRDARYRSPLLKALDFVLEAQFPNGAWPQRYPLKYDFQFMGKKDYTSFYTFNDEVIFNNIMDLQSAYEFFGDQRYKDSATRGMDFYLISQTGYPQGGWCDQYSHDMKPAQGRGYEPAGVYISTTCRCIDDLKLFYKITGDTRYLNPIDRAIAWMENSVIDTDPSKNFTHAYFYETGTNKPLYTHRYGSSKDDGGYMTDYVMGNPVCHWPQVITVNTGELRKEYRRILSLTPRQAREEYDREKDDKRTETPLSDGEIESLMNALDPRGAWVTDVQIAHYANPCVNNRKGTIIKGIETRVYVENMYRLITALRDTGK